ncbi:hypothetical protein B0A49_12450, partial [Cryomyces minteri]
QDLALKGVSFLSRIIGNKKKDVLDDPSEAGSDQGDLRPEGMDAQIFSQPIDNISFNPRHPQPPAYIKIRSRNKKEKDFNRLFLAQELRCKTGNESGRRPSSGKTGSTGTPGSTEGTIWAMEFSKDGKYLAAAGQDKIVRLWAVLSTPEHRRAHEREEEAASGITEGQASHLSAPVFQSKPIREYEGHTSTVLDLSWSKNNFLLSSSMDKTVRLWHVSRTECLCAFKHNDFVPSIAFHPKDDRFFLAGSLDSKLRLWSIPDKSVAFWSQLPDMITAVSFTPDGKTAIAGCLTGLCLFYETEGLKYQSQIHAKSTHGKNARGSKITGIQTIYMPPGVASGEIKVLISSNDSRVRMYNYRDKSPELKFTGNENNYSQIRATFSDDARYVICGSEDRKAYIWSTGPSEGEKRDKRPVEMFEAHTSITTSSILAPMRTRQLLSGSEDPLYDLCNPPHITLVSRADSQASNSRAPTENGSIQATPLEVTFRRPEESSAYIARSAHPGDLPPRLRFRQRRSDNWETSSVFSKKVGSSILGRTQTRGSARTTRRDSVSTQPPSDRILSWRQGIASNGSFDRGSTRNGTTTRSVSPRKSVGQLSVRSGPVRQDSAGLPNAASETLPSTTSTTSSSPARPSISSDVIPFPSVGASAGLEKASVNQNTPWLGNEQSSLYWGNQNWRDQAKHRQSAHLEAPNLIRRVTTVSALSSEEESAESGEHEEVRCKKCGSTSFKAKVERGVVAGGTRLVCTRCGMPAG